MARLWGWVALGVGALGCGGHAVADGVERGPNENEGRAGAGGSSLNGGASSGGGGSSGSAAIAGVPATDGSLRLRPRIGGPTPEGDGRLPDIPEATPGGSGIGWDLCTGSDLTSSVTDCVDCPASRGSRFLVAKETLSDEPIASLKPQLYFYFEPPQGSEALWFDVSWLSGSRLAELSVWETDTGCKPQNVGRLFDISPLLEGERGDWYSACLPLDEARKLQGLGLRIGAAGQVGLDSLRFGARCDGS